MKPFNLEEAKSGKPICTRNGKKARIICTDLNRGYYNCKNGKIKNIIAAIDVLEDGFEQPIVYTNEGLLYEGKIDKLDLMMAEEPKCPFKPFDKVLVRDTDMSEWDCEFFSRYVSDKPHPFYCLHNVYAQCIPYNEETEHLIGTTDAPPEKYVIW